MTAIRYQLHSVSSFISQNECIQNESCHYPLYVMRLEKQIPNPNKKDKISIKSCKKKVSKSLKP